MILKWGGHLYKARLYDMERWYVLFSKPCKEFLLRDQLMLKGLEVYLPLLVHGGDQARPHPLFPRYLFAHLDLDIVSPTALGWMPGLSRMVMFGDDYATLDQSVVDYIAWRLDQLQCRGRAPFAPGQRVRLRPGRPFAALEAVFERPLSEGKRAAIFVETLGRLVRCEVAMDDLERPNAHEIALGLMTP